jgi:hypothetical protein
MTALHYDFEWQRGDKFLIFPVLLEKTVEDNWKGEGNLLCECGSTVQQKYICSNCGKQATIGQIKLRKDKDTGIIYTTEEYNAFMKSKVKQKIKVVGEIPLMDFINQDNIELIEGNFFKIFGDEEYSKYIEKLREYLTLKGIGLMVLVGYYNKERAVVLLPTRTRILGVFLRDKRLVRGETSLNETIAQFSIDKNIDKHYEFLQIKRENKPIPIPKEEKVEPKIDLFFEGELKQLKETVEETKEKLKKKVAVQV